MLRAELHCTRIAAGRSHPPTAPDAVPTVPTLSYLTDIHPPPRAPEADTPGQAGAAVETRPRVAGPRVASRALSAAIDLAYHEVIKALNASSERSPMRRESHRRVRSDNEFGSETDRSALPDRAPARRRRSTQARGPGYPSRACRSDRIRQALKYFASGCNRTNASVDCSGCSCSSSESTTPMRSAASRSTSFARSSRSGQAP